MKKETETIVNTKRHPSLKGAGHRVNTARVQECASKLKATPPYPGMKPQNMKFNSRYGLTFVYVEWKR